MEFSDLREHQKKAIVDLRSGWKQHKNHLINAACGFGKTALASYIAQSFANAGKRVVFVAPYVTLVDQTYARFQQYGHKDLSVLWRDDQRYDASSLVQIASADTIIRRQWPENCDVMIWDECFSGDTEVLTGSGFVKFNELKDEHVAEYHDSGEITFTSQYEKINKAPSEGVLRVKSGKNFDLIVTPGHNMLVDGKFIEARNIKGGLKKYAKMTRAGLASGSDEELTPFERFLICFQADGSIHKVRKDGSMRVAFSFSKQKKIEAFKNICEEAGIEICYTDKSPELGSRKERVRFIVSVDKVYSKDISKYFDIKTMSLKKARAIIEEMVLWDGHFCKDRYGTYLYTSTSKSMADFYQSIAVISGYGSNMGFAKDDRKETFSGCWRLHIQKNNCLVGLQSWEPVHDKDYSENVYCVRVSSGKIIIRRGGRTLVVGNCHRMKKRLIDLMQEMDFKTIGLTATPFSKWMGKYYTNFIKPTTTRELIESAWLTPFEIYAPCSPDMTGAKMRTNEYGERDYSEAFAAEVMGDAKIVGNILANWLANGENLPTIGFAPTVSTANAYTVEFRNAGVAAEVVTAETPTEERAAIFRRFSQGIVKVIWNVGVLGAGFDSDVRCIIWARPTKSETVWVQGTMRGSRPADGKDRCLLFDHAGTYLSLGDPADIEYYSLPSEDEDSQKKREIEKEERKEKIGKICSKCSRAKEPGEYQCKKCGHKPLAGEFIDGIDETRDIVKATGAKKEKTKEEKEDFWRQLLGYQRERAAIGKPISDGYLSHTYREWCGVWPRGMPSHPMPCGPVVRNFIKHKNIKFAKGKARANG